MFGRATLDAVRLPYRNFNKPGVRFLAADGHRDRSRRRARHHRRRHLRRRLSWSSRSAPTTTSTRRPGLAEGGNEFYSVAGATRLRDVLPAFTKGHAIIGVCGAPFKCPPAPSEAALMLHDFLDDPRRPRALRDHARHAVRRRPVPPSPETSRALVAAFAEREHHIRARPPGRRARPRRASVAILDDGSELPFDLFLGVPKHRAPGSGRSERHGRGRLGAGRSEDPRDTISRRLRRRRHRRHRHAQGRRLRRRRGRVRRRGASSRKSAAAQPPDAYSGAGSCYIEFGAGRIGRVDVDFFSGPAPTGKYHRAVDHAPHRETALRLQPPRALVRDHGVGAAREARTVSRLRRTTQSLPWVTHDAMGGSQCVFMSCLSSWL